MFQYRVAECLNRLGRRGEAEHRFREAYTLSMHWFGPKHPSTLHAQFYLATALAEWQSNVEAADLLRENVMYLAEVYGNEHRNTLRSVKLLVKVLERFGREEEAQGVRVKFKLSVDEVYEEA